MVREDDNKQQNFNNRKCFDYLYGNLNIYLANDKLKLLLNYRK